MGVRRIVFVAAIVLATLIAMMSTALVVLTTRLHDASTTLRSTAHLARMAREAEVDLLVHERTTEPSVRTRIESKLEEDLQEEPAFPAPSARTHEAYVRARKEAERYVALSRAAAAPAEVASALEQARLRLGDVVSSNIADANRAQAAAGRLDDISDTVAPVLTGLMLLTLGALIWWFRWGVVQPSIGLSDLVGRFAHGELGARGVPSGATELRHTMVELNKMAAILEDQRRARLAHLAGVAHDLRSPLAALQLSVGFLASPSGAPLDESIRRSLEVARRQVSRLSRMVEDLLDATRLEAGELALVVSDVDIRDVVSDVAKLFSNVSAQHTLQIGLPGAPLVVRCDASRVEQILTNLISNAIKYSPGGGAVVLEARSAGDTVEISVRDPGIGIRSEERDDIWLPFRRTSVSAESIPGVGLGLWTARRLARAHGGDISVESTPGRGSTFVLSLPRNGGRGSPESRHLLLAHEAPRG